MRLAHTLRTYLHHIEDTEDEQEQGQERKGPCPVAASLQKAHSGWGREGWGGREGKRVSACDAEWAARWASASKACGRSHKDVEARAEDPPRLPHGRG